MAEKRADSPIRIFITGGTFDKQYDELKGALYFKDSHLPEMLRLGRARLLVEIRTLMMIDSLYMTDADREIIVEQCRAVPESRIVITHGTDTMAATARALARRVPGKTIVLVGALAPARFSESDASFNLGMAFATAQVAEPGVYITMSGSVFRADKVVKDRAKGAFVPLGA